MGCGASTTGFEEVQQHQQPSQIQRSHTNNQSQQIILQIPGSSGEGAGGGGNTMQRTSSESSLPLSEPLSGGLSSDGSGIFTSSTTSPVLSAAKPRPGQQPMAHTRTRTGLAIDQNHRTSVSAILTSQTGKKQHILLLELDLSLSTYFVKTLTGGNYRVTPSTTSAEAAFDLLKAKNSFQPKSKLKQPKPVKPVITPAAPPKSEGDSSEDDDDDDDSEDEEIDEVNKTGWVNDESFDAILIDLTPTHPGTTPSSPRATAGGSEGMKFLNKIKQHGMFRHIPVLTMLDPNAPALQASKLNGLTLLNNSLTLGANEYILLNSISSASGTASSASSPPIPDSILMLKFYNLFTLQTLKSQQGTLIDRGNKYKQELARAERTVKNHQRTLQLKEKKIETLTQQIETSKSSSPPLDPEEEAARRAERVAEFNQTPLLQIGKKFDDLLKDSSFSTVPSDVLEELVRLRHMLTSSTNLYAPDFEAISRRSAEEGADASMSISASWLRSRFSVIEPRSPATLVDPRSGSFIQLPIPNPSNLNQECLAAFERPDWNIYDWTVDDLLPCLALLCHNFDLQSLLKISDEKLRSFFYEVPKHYNIVPYHNIHHAINVFQMVYVLCRHHEAKSYITPQNILAVLIGALGHDMDHPGLNNAYMIDTSAEVALIYNDISVLENHHCASTFKLLRSPANNIFEGMKPADIKDVRATIITCIMATDMVKHFEFHTLFQTKLKNREPSVPAFDRQNDKDRSLICQMLVKCSDIGNVTCPWPVSEEWCRRANLEFFYQGDLERARGKTPAPFLDRTKITAEQNTLSFIDYVARPLFVSLFDFLPKSKVYLDALDFNRGKLADICKVQKETAAAAAASAAAASSTTTSSTPGKLTISVPVPPPVITPANNAFPSEQARLDDLKRFTPRTSPSFIITTPTSGGPPIVLYKSPGGSPTNNQPKIAEGNENEED